MNGFTQYGKLKDMYQHELSRIRKMHQISIRDGVVYIRNKARGRDVKRVVRKKGVGLNGRFYGAIGILMFMSAFMGGMDASKVDVDNFYIKPNINPVRFTESELEMIRKQYNRTKTVHDYIKEASREFNVSYKLLDRIAFCESRYNPKAQNGKSSAGGLFQFIDSTWVSTLKTMGEDTKQSKYSPEINARAAAWKIAHGGIRAWSASKSCHGRGS